MAARQATREWEKSTRERIYLFVSYWAAVCVRVYNVRSWLVQLKCGADKKIIIIMG